MIQPGWLASKPAHASALTCSWELGWGAGWHASAPKRLQAIKTFGINRLVCRQGERAAEGAPRLADESRDRALRAPAKVPGKYGVPAGAGVR